MNRRLPHIRRPGPRFSGGGGGPLLKFSDGTFTRSTEGSYRPSASSLAWAGANVLRYDLGVALFEGASENLLNDPEALDAANWVGLAPPGADYVLADQEVAPDGAMDADELGFVDVSSSRLQQEQASFRVAPADNAAATWSAWARIKTPGMAFRLLGRDKSGTLFGDTAATLTPTDWQRFSATRTDVGSGASAEARFQNVDTVSSPIEGAIYAWGAQWEELPWPTSYIRSGAARGSDNLTFTSFPDEMINGRWEFDWYPLFHASQMDPLISHMLYFMRGTGSFDGVYALGDGAGGCRLRFSLNNTNVVNEPVIDFSAGQRLTISIDMAAGEMTLSGATSGNFTRTWTPPSFSPTAFAVGFRDVSGGTSYAFSRLAEPRAW